MADQSLPSFEGPPTPPDAELRDPRLVLTGQRRALYEALLGVGGDEIGGRLARCYVGAIAVLGMSGNPERHAQAGHSLRELMNMLPEAVDVERRALRERLSDRGQRLETAWGSAQASECRRDGGPWQGAIDRPLQKFLAEAEAFYSWKAAHMPAVRKATDETLNQLDVVGKPTPARLRELNVERWMQIREYFVTTAHHGEGVDVAEFDGYIDELEREILNRLRPRTFDTFDEIDDILGSEDSDAA